MCVFRPLWIWPQFPGSAQDELTRNNTQRTVKMKPEKLLCAFLTGLWLAGSASSALADYESDVLALSPIAYWRLNETTGTLADNIGSLGNSADGTYTNNVTLGVEGSARKLGEANTAISVGPADGTVKTGSSFLSNMSAFTISAFVRPADSTDDRIGLVGQNDAIEFGFIHPGVLEIWTPSTDYLNVDWPFGSDSWHHIAATGDGTDLRIYLDGVLAGTRNAPTGNYGSSSDFVNIGGQEVFGNNGKQYTGLIDEVAIFDQALDDQQIKALASGIKINAGFNDAWYNPVTNGQGYFITVFPDIGYVSLAWFTYDTELPPMDATANLGDPGHRWLTAIGPIEGNHALMDIEMTSGGIFDTPTEITRTDPAGTDGTLLMTFVDCGSGTIEYDIISIGKQGVVPIQRVANDNSIICEALGTD